MPSPRLYLRGLPEFVGKDEVLRYLSSYGNVVEVKILNGYGFVEFEQEKDAVDVLETFSKQPFLGTKVIVEYAHPRKFKPSPSATSVDVDEDVSPTKPRLAPAHAQLRYPVVVTNLPKRLCWQELKDFGRSAGGLVAFCDVDKTRRGRGFIEYLSQEDADRAIQKLDKKELMGNIVRLSTYDMHVKRDRSRSPARRRSEQRADHSPECARRSSSRSYRSDENYHSYDVRTQPTYSRRGDGYPRSDRYNKYWSDAAYAPQLVSVSRSIYRDGDQAHDELRSKYEKEWERSRKDWYGYQDERRSWDYL